MRMLAEEVAGREPDDRFAVVLGQVATDYRDLGAGRETVDLQGPPDDLAQVDDGLIVAKGQRVLVGTRFVGLGGIATVPIAVSLGLLFFGPRLRDLG